LRLLPVGGSLADSRISLAISHSGVARVPAWLLPRRIVRLGRPEGFSGVHLPAAPADYDPELRQATAMAAPTGAGVAGNLPKLHW